MDDAGTHKAIAARRKPGDAWPLLMKAFAFALLASGPAFAGGCSPPQLAGEPLRPTTAQDAFGGVQCSAVRPQSEPDLMAWDPQSRGLLSVLHRQRVVVVRYAAKGCNVELELLSNCQAKGSYDFLPYSSRKSQVAHNQSELFAQLPVGALHLAGNLKGDRAIRTDFMFVGIDSLPSDQTFRVSDLRGTDCARATHVVNRIYLGGFAMSAGESRSLDAGGSLFGASAGAKSDASFQQLDSEGNVADCETAQQDGRPNNGCQTPLRIGLLAIDAPIATSTIRVDKVALKLPVGMRLRSNGTSCVEDERANAKITSSAWYEHDTDLEQYCPRTALYTQTQPLFDGPNATLVTSDDNDQWIELVTTLLRENSQITTLAIEGNSSNVGPPEKNLTLTGQRALAIKRQLIARGISSQRLLAVGFGQSKPIADNTTEEGRMMNERIELEITGLNGEPFGGPQDRGGRVFR